MRGMREPRKQRDKYTAGDGDDRTEWESGEKERDGGGEGGGMMRLTVSVGSRLNKPLPQILGAGR